MEPILRAAFVYLFILIIFRMSGKRTISKMTSFDFVLLLIVGEAVQEALLSEDYSLTGALLVIITLITLDMVFAYFSQKSGFFDRLTKGVPVLLVDDGEPKQDRMRDQRIEMDDILEAARRNQGLEHPDQIKYAILEKDGQISIVPMQNKE